MIRSLLAHPRLALIRKVGEAGLLQLFGIVVSILVIRVFGEHDKEGYGRFALAMTLQGGLTLLIDAGVSIGLMSQGGAAWPDQRRVGGVFAAAMKQRRLLIACFLPPLAAYSVWQLVKLEASLPEAVAITTLSLAACLLQVRTTLHHNLLSLAGRYVDSQRVSFVAALVRLGLTIALLAWINPILALLANFAGTWLELFLKRRATPGLADFSQPPDPEALAAFRRLAYALLPSTAFHIAQSNLPILIQALGGNTSNVADYGALSRVCLPLGIIGALASGFLQPHFAKLAPDQLKPFLLRVVLGAGGIALAVAFGGWLLRKPLLWTLGDAYSHLGPELSLILLLTGANFFIEAIFALCQARAWLGKVWIGAAATLALQLLLFPFFQLDTIIGALGFSALSMAPRLLIVTWLCWQGLSGRGLLVSNGAKT